MKRVLNGLKPEKVFYYFEEICHIPHGSGNTKEISDYCVQFAKERNLTYLQDKWNNVIIKKEATKGYETVPTLILQGHLDMVCEKVEGWEHDFLKDPLSLVVDKDEVYAKGTTLGGDDGIAISYALAILDEDDIPHPPLEVVFTTEEETGMNGAKNLDCQNLSGKYLINIDSEEEDCVLAGCAGGASVCCTFPITYERASGREYCFWVGGLKGGHSGTDIDKQRANAILLLARFLDFLRKKNASFSLLYMEGGGKDNAIPRDAKIFFLTKEKEETLRTYLSSFEQSIKEEYQCIEPTLCFSLVKGEEKQDVFVVCKEWQQKIMTFLLHAFLGVFTMSEEIPGMVESSSNLGIMQMTKEEIRFCFAPRSSKESLRDFLINHYQTWTKALGGTSTVEGIYPPWEYREDSKLRTLAVDKYRQLRKKELSVLSIHAGLECGIFASKIKDFDAISIGPDILDIHTPTERLRISSVARVYEYLLLLLKDAKDYL